MRSVLPEEYRNLDDYSIIERIKRIRDKSGSQLLLLGHHYQRDEIINLSDIIGDSFQLSWEAAHNENARYIVFCGVNFMAESAAILCGTEQIVLHPDTEAGCPLADSADVFDVEKAWRELKNISPDDVIVPVTYVNSDSEIKAFCGKHNGTVCTSSNAAEIFDWAFENGDKIFFFPDEHLGRNTANKKAVSKEHIIRWDPTLESGGNSPEEIKNAKVILWNGYCHVHTFFKLGHIEEARKRYPGCKIVVHPECEEEVVNASDYDGSTSFIVNFVKKADKGSTSVIGTEINLVSRLAKNTRGKKIVPLARSLCPNMWKISLNDLLYTLDNLGQINKVEVNEEIKIHARIALKKMLEITRE